MSTLDEAYVPHTFVAHYRQETWSHYTVETGVTAQCLAFTENGEEVLSLGADGTVHMQGLGSGSRIERLYVQSGATRNLRRMLDIRQIDGSVFAVGMGRAVYERDAPNRWTASGRGAEPPADHFELTGFRSICGVDRSNMFAVGFEGEIWQFDGHRWFSVDSPTNMRLDCARVLGGQVYACGAAGVIARGRDGRWEAIVQDITRETLWSMAVFDSKLFLADRGSVYRLTEDLVLEPVDFGLSAAVSTAYLDASTLELWSVGWKDILCYDRSSWRRITPPGEAHSDSPSAG